jgi:hypothetical protein
MNVALFILSFQESKDSVTIRASIFRACYSVFRAYVRIPGLRAPGKIAEKFPTNFSPLRTPH